MSQDGSNPEQDLQQREQELRERELSVRIRELEAELQDKQTPQEPEASQPDGNHSSKRSRQGSSWIKTLNLIGFFLLGLAVVILTLRYRFLIIFFLILAFLGFVAYKLFWEKP